MLTKENIPMHKQIQEDIMQQISSGKHPKGSRLPSERDLAELYDVSRVTIRQTIANLVADGVLEKHQGAGTFVTLKKVEQEMHQWTGVVNELVEQGYEVKVEVLESEYLEFSEKDYKIWNELDQDMSKRIYKIKRLIHAEGKPLLLDFNYCSEEIGEKFEMFDLSKDIIYKGLRILGYDIDHAEQLILAKIATASRAKLLQIPCGHAVLDVERTVYTKEKNPLLYTRALFVGDKYAYKTSLKIDSVI